jgi:hypothetical protein
MKLNLIILTEELTIVQLPPDKKIPNWVSGNFYSITRTEDELSIVCNQDIVPKNTKADKGWRAFKILGPLDFSLVGILANLSTILAKVNISIFSISTYNTDYLLVKKENLKKATKTLESAGHNVK